MGVTHDYKCEQHGYFEAREPVCPEGCEDGVMLVFLQAPATISAKTKHTDKTVNQLAMDFNMTNIKSTRAGENQAGFYKRKNTTPDAEVTSQNIPAREPRPGDAAVWGGGFKGLNMKSILSGRAVQSVHGESVGINPKDAGNLTGPKAASYIADQDNLKISK